MRLEEAFEYGVCEAAAKTKNPITNALFALARDSLFSSAFGTVGLGNSQRGRSGKGQRVTALKVLRGFQRFSEVFSDF